GTQKKLFIHSALAGLSMWLFHWWYEHPGIIIAYLGVFVLAMPVSRVELKKAALAVLLFVLFSNPLHIYSGLHHLF
ncbi:MAG: hypothetical protein LRY51_12975, partial [Geovibrio sp.]|nr:hypothetical protein [Geovibrio sp.]